MLYLRSSDDEGRLLIVLIFVSRHGHSHSLLGSSSDEFTRSSTDASQLCHKPLKLSVIDPYLQVIQQRHHSSKRAVQRLPRMRRVLGVPAYNYVLTSKTKRTFLRKRKFRKTEMSPGERLVSSSGLKHHCSKPQKKATNVTVGKAVASLEPRESGATATGVKPLAAGLIGRLMVTDQLLMSLQCQAAPAQQSQQFKCAYRFLG